METEIHKHEWERSARRHKKTGMIFVVCYCGIERQATIKNGFVNVFHTGSDRGGKSIIKTKRLKRDQIKQMESNGFTFSTFVDFAIEKLLTNK